ncbi:hypothetical protein TNCV_4668501 [Trichonephila clavipes]|nr:hypothetical protein TNCV_4668501 [Trichonephila clavipes]
MIRAPYKVRFWAPSWILQRVYSWRQLGFGLLEPWTSPQCESCGGVRYTTGELHATNIHGRVVIPKPLLLAWNAMQILEWCRDHLSRTQWLWEQVV